MIKYTTILFVYELFKDKTKEILNFNSYYPINSLRISFIQDCTHILRFSPRQIRYTVNIKWQIFNSLNKSLIKMLIQKYIHNFSFCNTLSFIRSLHDLTSWMHARFWLHSVWTDRLVNLTCPNNLNERKDTLYAIFVSRINWIYI